MLGALSVLLIESHPFVRRALAARLVYDEAIATVAALNEAPGAAELARLQPDVILYGISGRTITDVPPLAAIVARLALVAPVIVLSSLSDEQEAQYLVDAGASVYLQKTIATADLLAHIKQLACQAKPEEACQPVTPP